VSAQPSAPRPVHAPPLDQHRLLGGGGLAALIDDDAVVDWWCHPGLDGPPQLWSLLDADGGTARWWNATGVRTIGLPAGPIARTAVNIDGEVVSCWDALIRLRGHPVLVRLVRSTTKPLGITHELRAGGFGPDSPATVTVTTSSAPPHTIGRSTYCSLEVTPAAWGAVLIGGAEALAGSVPLVEVLAAVEAAEERAQRLVAAGHVVQAHRDRVQTSLLVLDACTDPTTGAVVAAPTTSLPEVVGADRQFDYRYAWLRDASLAAGVAAALGRADITQHHVRWLAQRCLACEGVPVPVVRTSGEPVPDEVVVDGVAGWAGSQPVRTGNAAKDQVQVDGAGMAAEAVWALVRTGAGLGHRAYRSIAALADRIVAEPRSRSGGIWELRTPIEGTSADIGRWLLFDRARRLSLLHEPWARRRRASWREQEEAARRRVLMSCLPSGALPLVPGRPGADAAGLLVVVLGLVDGRSPDAARIVEGTLAELGIGQPVRALTRYPSDLDDGFEGRVAGFVPVSWMAVSALAQIGRIDEAEALADRLCGSLPGLQPEVVDGDVPLGNTPLVWSHAEAARALYLIRVARLRGRVGGAGVALWEVGRALRARRRSAPTRAS
jgi:hypothetical protein